MTVDLGPGTGLHCGMVGLGQGPCPEFFQADAFKWYVEGFPRGPGRDAEVPTKSGESGSSRLGCGLSWGGLGAGFQPQASPSGRKNLKHPKRSLFPAGTSPLACPMHVAGGAGGGSRREVLIYLITSPLWRRQAECLLGQWTRKLRPGAEK